MRFTPDKKQIKLFIIISIPILIITQYYLFKFGILRPMVRGVELKISKGDYVEDIDQFVMKLNEEVTLSSGDYIYIPTYAKKPNIWFNVLDKKEVIKIKEGNTLVALKEGTSSVAIMKNSRALRKVNIKVVDPKVQKLLVEPENDLVYVGDKSKINTVIDVDYNRFKEKEKATYESSDENIVKVSGNKLEAVGVGRATVTVKAQDKEEKLRYNIRARVAKIDIADTIEIGIGENKQLNPNIITSPKGLKPPKIEYQLLGRKLSVERSIALDERNGTIQGIRPGSEKVKITCDNKEKIVTVKVTDKISSDNKIKNLRYSHQIVGNKLQIFLEWDYLEGIFDYDVYLKNNSLGESNYKVVKNVKIKEDEIKINKKVSTTIEVDLVDGDLPDINIYVVGKSKDFTTGPSNIVSIKPQQNDIQNLSVKNLSVYVDKENNVARFTWDDIGIEGAQYSIFVKNNLSGNSGYELLEGNIGSNEYTMNLTGSSADLEFYVRANKDDKYSGKSNIVNIKFDSNEDNSGGEEENKPDEDTPIE